MKNVSSGCVSEEAHTSALFRTCSRKIDGTLSVPWYSLSGPQKSIRADRQTQKGRWTEHQNPRNPRSEGAEPARRARWVLLTRDKPRRIKEAPVGSNLPEGKLKAGVVKRESAPLEPRNDVETNNEKKTDSGNF